MAPQAFKRLHSGKHEPQNAREWVAKVIDNHWVESFIMFLVLCDLICVGVEAGIDAHLLCIGGEVVSGQHLPSGQHAAGSQHAAGAEHAASDLGEFTILPKVPLSRRWAEPRQLLLAVDPPAGVAAAAAAAFWRTGPRKQHEVQQLPPGSHEPDHPGSEGEEQQKTEATPSLRAAPAMHPHDAKEGGTPAADHHEGVAAEHHEEEVLRCDTSDGHHAKHVTHICHVCSIAILCVFMVELLLKWWANPTEFLAGWCHKLDLFVVSVSLIIDTVVMSYIESQHHNTERERMEKEGLQLVAFLLILSRSWRVVRICHGFFEQYQHIQEEAEKQAEKPREENAAFRKVLLKMGLDPDKELEKVEQEPGVARGSSH